MAPTEIDPAKTGEDLPPAERSGSHKRTRAFAIEIAPRERAADASTDAPALYDISFSSDAPVVRKGSAGNWTEILGHGKGEVNTSYLDAGIAVLVDHRGDQVGVLHDGRIDGGKGRGAIQFSQNPRGQEIERDVVAGIRRFISVGYSVDQEKLVTKDDKKGDKKGDTYRVTDWTPVEVSIVATPADLSVGIGRSATEIVNPIATRDGDPVREERQMPEEKDVVTKESESAAAATSARATVDVGAERNAVRAEEKARVGFIREMCVLNKLDDATAEDMIVRGLDERAAGKEIMALRATKGTPASPSAESLKDLPEKDKRRWSLVRCIRIGAGMAARERGETTDEFGREKFDGVEAEVHRELMKSMPDGAQYKGGIMIPFRMPGTREMGAEVITYLGQRAALGDAQAGLMLRTLSANAITKGAEAVFEQAGQFIELLRPQSAVLSSGARLLTGLTGPVSFPKQSVALSASWVGENPVADVTDSDMSIGLVLMAAKTLQASTGYTRQLLAQSSLDIEALVRADFAAVHALAIDRASMHGKGNSGEPLGIYKTTGVGATAFGGAVTFAKLIDQQTQVAAASAAQGALGLITTPNVAGTCRKTLEFPTAPGGQKIWTGGFYEGEVGGYQARATANVSSTMTGTDAIGGTNHGGIFGNWGDFLIGLFSAMELVVDPYRLKKRGIIEVTSFQLIDCIARHPESFSVATGLTP